MYGMMRWMAGLSVVAPLVMACGCCETSNRVNLISETFETEPLEGGWRRATLSHDDTVWHVQEKDEYCWAACIQTVMALRGEREIPTQGALWLHFVSSPFALQHREAATFQEIRLALAPEYAGKMEGYFVLDMRGTKGRMEVLEQLAKGEPVVLGLREPGAEMGHAYVAYGMEYRSAGPSTMEQLESTFHGLLKASGERATETVTYEVRSLQLFDPDPYGERLVELSFEDVRSSLDFAISASSARAFLSEQQAWLRQHDRGPGLYTRGLDGESLYSAGLDALGR